MAEATDLKSVKCGFESHLCYQKIQKNTLTIYAPFAKLVRQESAKLSCVGSNPTRCSKLKTK